MNAAYLTDQDALSEKRRAAILAELAHILDSPSFRGSRRCSRLLEYSVHQVLKGSTPESFKERTIGIEALQRTPDYDTSEDAIVRVTANEVRKRLAQYYQVAGTSTDPVIALPAGSYAVTFHWQLPQPEPEPAKAPDRKPDWLAPRVVAALALLVLVVCAVAYAISTVRPGSTPFLGRSAAALQSSFAKADPLWSRVFNAGQKTNIVLSDAVYREMQYFLGRDVSLSEYLAPGYPGSLLASAKPETRQAIAFLGRQQTTSIGSATLGSRLLVFGARMGGDPVIRYPRHINAREFNTDNFILLGSRLSIPWGELFEPSMNFPLATDAATHRFYLRNRAPRPGEPAEYRESDNHEQTYADVAVLPNLAGTGTVVILNGIDMVAAEASGEFALDGSLSARLASMPAGPSGNRYAEILIRVRAIAGTAANIEVVATRQVAPRNSSGYPGAGR
jgi:hypothetical protein